MRHDSNQSPDAQPWARDVNAELDTLRAENDELKLALAALGGVDGGVSDRISELYTQMRYLYSQTGNVWPPVAATPPPPPTIPPPPVQQVYTTTADWSRTWGSSSFYTGGGSDTNGTYLYQGSNPENKVGMWHYPLGPVIGKQIIGADMYIANINSPYQAGFTAHFGSHSNSGAPGGKPGRSNAFDVGWSRGLGQWFALPSWTYAGLSNGGITGFTVGASGASDPDYAYFAGVGTGNPPQIRITFYA